MLDDTTKDKNLICKQKIEGQAGLLAHCMHMNKEGKCHQCQRGFWAVGYNLQGQHQVCGKRLSDKHAAKVIAIHARESAQDPTVTVGDANKVVSAGTQPNMSTIVQYGALVAMGVLMINLM